jgi:predicted permease
MPTALTELVSRIRGFFRSGSLDSDFDEELQSHLAMLEEENIRRGMKPEDARRTACLTLGRATQVREAHRDARGLPLLDSLMQDVRYALRSLSKTPGFTAAAILTLGIGIGANTAIFSTIDETLFRPLDFPRPEQLADVFAFNKASSAFLSSSYPDYEDLRARSTTFHQLSAFVRMPMNVSWGERNERLPVEAVTGNFFSMLEMPPAAGRAFRDDDDSAAGGRVAMVSEEIADAGAAGAKILGAKILIEGQPFTIVGTVSKRYHGTNLNWGDPPRVWIPLQATAIVYPRFRTIDIFHQRAGQWLLITGRLKPGFSVTQAQAEMQTIAAGIAQSAPAINRDISAAVFSASRSKFWPAYRASITRSLSVFAVAAALVLLLTCTNLSNLLLSRAVGRRREFAIRLSMGAGRGRLLRQLLTESILLSAPSCAAALAIAYGLGRVLAHFPNALGLPLALDSGIESRVLCFCIALSVVTTILFGLAPALQATRTDVLSAMKESGNTVSGGGNHGLRNSLLVLQVSFTTILLAGGGLFGRSVMQAWSVDLGFRTEGLLTAAFSAPPFGAESSSRFRRTQEELRERLRKAAGVRAATLASSPPLDGLRMKTQVEGDQLSITADRREVGPDFFQTMGIPLLWGREFDIRDSDAAPKVAIVNEALAARLWPGANALGRSVQVQKATMLVVGVARNSKYGSVWEEPQPSLYVASSQAVAPASYLIVRTSGKTGDSAATAAREWNGMLPHLPLYSFRTANELRNVALAPQRMALWVFGAFGFVAIVLASVGLYSSVSYAVARRTREIGIRLAVGAKPGTVVWQLIFQAMVVAGAGLAVGTAIGGLLARFVAAQVKGVSVYDGATFGFVIALLGIVALLAAAIPARRAARIDPQVALRSE